MGVMADDLDGGGVILMNGGWEWSGDVLFVSHLWVH